MMWRRSSSCESNACVEVAFQRSSFCDTDTCVEVAFHKSSRSAGNGACVEVGASGDRVLVRDSKDPDGPVLAFSTGAFGEFLSGLKAGEFDRGGTEER